MQFVLYIKFSLSYLKRYNIFPLTVFCLLTLLISACSGVPDAGVGETVDLKSISKNITDLFSFHQNEETLNNQSNNRMQQPKSDTKNTYLTQETRLMSEVPNDVIKIYQQALVLMDQQEWSAAQVLFEQVVAKQPNLSGSYVNQALILRELSKRQQGAKRTKQLNTAYLLVTKAIKVNPLNPYAQIFKGQIEQEKGQFALAEQHYAAALSIWPNYAQAQLNMAILLELYRGKLLEAYPYYEAYLHQNVDDIQVQRWQAALAIKIKRAGLQLPVQQGE